MRYESQQIAIALANAISDQITAMNASELDGIPVRHYGYIVDAACSEEDDVVELTINPGGVIWEIRPQELAPIPPTAGKRRPRKGSRSVARTLAEALAPSQQA
jgi:hypothetical protein